MFLMLYKCKCMVIIVFIVFPFQHISTSPVYTANMRPYCAGQMAGMAGQMAGIWHQVRNNNEKDIVCLVRDGK